MSEIYEVADAAKALLDAQDFADQITLKRVYLPVEDLAAIAPTDKALTYIISMKDAFSLVARDTQQEEISLNIGVLMKLPATVDPTDESGNEAIDDMVQLCRQIARSFKPGFEAGDAWWTETAYAPIFDSNLMRTNRIFAAVINVKFTQANEPEIS